MIQISNQLNLFLFVSVEYKRPIGCFLLAFFFEFFRVTYINIALAASRLAAPYQRFLVVPLFSALGGATGFFINFFQKSQILVAFAFSLQDEEFKSMRCFSSTFLFVISHF